MKALHGKKIEGRTLWVEPAKSFLTKRMANLPGQFQKSWHDRQAAGAVNLYVNNLDKRIDDQRLYNEFSSFGTITSAKVHSYYLVSFKPWTVAA